MLYHFISSSSLYPKPIFKSCFWFQHLNCDPRNDVTKMTPAASQLKHALPLFLFVFSLSWAHFRVLLSIPAPFSCSLMFPSVRSTVSWGCLHLLIQLIPTLPFAAMLKTRLHVGESLNPFLDSCVPLYIYTHSCESGLVQQVTICFCWWYNRFICWCLWIRNFHRLVFAAQKASNISRINVIRLVLW